MGETTPESGVREEREEMELESATTPPSSSTNEVPQTRPSNLHHILVILAGFTITSTTCALIFAFGVYQALYEEMAKQPNTPFSGSSTALIGLVGTLAIALMSMGGPFVMMWAKLYSPQVVVMAGGVVFGIASILASFSTRLWQFALTQGLLQGIGTCMAYVPTTSVAPTWFDKRRGLAMGVIIAGTGVGGMIWPPILRALITHVGFRNAMRVSGCLTTVLVVFAGYALRWEPRFQEQVRLQTRSLNRNTAWLLKVPLVNWQVAKSHKFTAQALGCFLQSAGYSTPLFFYAAYAQSRGYSTDAAANFITLHNASNFVSRILIGYAADRFGRLNMFFITTLLSAVAVLGFWLPSTFCQGTTGCSTKADVLFIFFTILYGAFASAYISLFPASLLELFGVQHFTSVNGALYLVRGMGALLGTPLTGLLIPRSTALTVSITYEKAAVTVGVLLFVASVACLWVRVEATMGERGRWKWKA